MGTDLAVVQSGATPLGSVRKFNNGSKIVGNESLISQIMDCPMAVEEAEEVGLTTGLIQSAVD